MKIRNKLNLLFSLIFSGILLLFAVTIYFSYESDREQEFYKRLKQQAATKVNLLIDVGIKPEVLQTIYKNTPNNLIHEEVAIYDTTFHLLYHDAADIDFIKETKTMIDEIVQHKEKRFVQEKHQAIGFTMNKNGKTYVVTVAAYDEYGFAKLKNLFYTLIISFGGAMLLIIVAGRFFAKQALKPVADMVDKVEEITATSLDLRVNVGSGKDEISELANTFNQMLNRLENSFDAQKQFVSNIAHELRTPLSSIITELQLSANKERNIAEYKQVIQNALNDAQKLAKLSTDLLDLAKASYDEREITFKEVRLDEILLDARRDILKSNPDYIINILFEKEIEDDRFISVNGNEYLLKVAFANLMDNGCKFSENKQSDVLIAFDRKKTTLKFSDKGVGIPEDDLKQVFYPFYRGENKKYADGNGIGLSLTKKIVTLHKGEILVDSKVNKGTTFSIELSSV